MKSFFQILQEAIGQDQLNANFAVKDLNGKMLHNAPIQKLGEWYKSRKNLLPNKTKRTLFGVKEIPEQFDPSKYQFFIFDPGAKSTDLNVEKIDGYLYRPIAWSELAQKFRIAKKIS
jgi:hypothetical protein